MDSKDKLNYERYLNNLPYLISKLTKEDYDDLKLWFSRSQSLNLNSFEDEIWVDIRDTNGLYSISNYSRVRRNALKSWVSKKGKIKHGEPPKILKQSCNKGYYRTMISVESKTRGFKVNREMAIHFIKNPHNHPMINHDNGIRYDGRIKNIEWCDNSHNQKHSYSENNRQNPKAMLGRTGYNCPNSKTVIQMDLNNNYIQEWGSASEVARVFNTFQSYISDCCRNKKESAVGYKWKYK